jgi:hypothetical protein
MQMKHIKLNNLQTNQQYLTKVTPQSRVLSQSAMSPSAAQEIFHLVWNPKVHYRLHKNQTLVSVMNQ